MSYWRPEPLRLHREARQHRCGSLSESRSPKNPATSPVHWAPRTWAGSMPATQVVLGRSRRSQMLGEPIAFSIRSVLIDSKVEISKVGRNTKLAAARTPFSLVVCWKVLSQAAAWEMESQSPALPLGKRRAPWPRITGRLLRPISSMRGWKSEVIVKQPTKKKDAPCFSGKFLFCAFLLKCLEGFRKWEPSDFQQLKCFIPERSHRED